jgi:hypothetical protein
VSEQWDVDGSVQGYLAENFRYVSRRSMVARVSRLVFGLAGVSLAETVGLFKIPEAEAQTGLTWKHCGMHGYECKRGCTLGVVGTGTSRAWTQCCPDPGCGLFFCCTYTDRCTPAYDPKRTDCWGAYRPGGGNQWCGVDRTWPRPIDPTPYSYVCTIVSCSSAGGKKKAEDCDCQSATLAANCPP